MARLCKFLIFASIFLAPAATRILFDEFFPACIIGLMVLSIIYILYFIISEDGLSEIVGSIILTALLAAGCGVLPIIFIPLMILWTIYGIASAMSAIASMKNNIFLCIILAVLLFAKDFFAHERTLVLAAMALYATAATVYAARVSKGPLKYAMMDVAITVLAIPLALLIIASIVGGLKNLFNTTFSRVAQSIRMPQNVAGYMRNGAMVSGYSREVSRVVTSQVGRTTAGMGAAAINAAAGAGRSITSASKDEA